MHTVIPALLAVVFVYALHHLLFGESKVYAIRRGIFVAITFVVSDIIANLFLPSTSWLAVWIVVYVGLLVLTSIMPSLRAWFFPRKN